MEALFLPISQVVEGAEHDREEAGEFFFGEEGGGASGAAAFFGGDLEEIGGNARGRCPGREGCDLGDDRVAELADELAGKLGSSIAGVEEAADDGEDVGGVVGVDGFEDLLVDGVGDGAHELADLGDF